MTIERKLEALNYTLPKAAKPVNDYLPVVVHRDLAFVSGQLPRVNGKLPYTGKVGNEVSIENAQECAKKCIINGLAVLKENLGSLEYIDRILKITGFVNSSSGFTGQSSIIDEASGLLVELFGEKGRHSRSAIGVSELPKNTPVEIEMIVSLRKA